MSNYTQIISKELGFSIENFPLDGKVYRFGRRNRYWAVGHEIMDHNKSYIIVNYGDWKDGKTRTYKNYEKRTFETFEFLVRQSKVIDELKQRVEQEKLEQHQLCREEYGPIFEKLLDPKDIHPYLAKKGLKSNGNAKINDKGILCIPLFDFEQFNGLQFISGNGEKWFSSGLKKKGSFAYLGKEYKKNEVYYFCEGYATGLTLLEALNSTVIVCLDCHNLGPVVEAFKQRFTDKKFVICADNDQWTDGNPGISKARAIKNVTVKHPIFIDTRGKPTDFNDLHYNEGIDAVTFQINSTIPKMSIELVPEDFKKYVLHGVESLDVPMEFIAYPLIASFGALLNNRVLVNPFGDYMSPCHLWSLGLGNKGCRKSAALNYSTRFLNKINENCIEERRAEYIKNKRQIELCKYKIKQNTPSGASKKLTELEIDKFREKREEIQDQLDKLIPMSKAFIFQDFTLASLVKLAKENGFGIVGLYDEMSAFFSTTRNAFNEGTASFFLQGWNATSVYNKTLVSNDTDYYLKNYISILIGKVQPSLLKFSLQEKNSAGQIQLDSGFLDRFQLMYYPDKINPQRKIFTEKLAPKELFRVESIFFDAYNFLHHGMDAMKAQEIGELDGEGRIVLKFKKSIFNLYEKQLSMIKQKHFKTMSDFEEGYYSKADRFLLSLIGIFYMIDYFAGNKPNGIDKKHLELAQKWIDFTYLHSKKVFTSLKQ